MNNLESNILKNAIKQLELKKAPDFIWLEMESRLEKDSDLKNSISGLSKRKAPDSVWDSIHDRLDRPNTLSRATENLPKRKLDNDMFEQIIATNSIRTNSLFNLKWVFGLAASIMLLITSVFIYEQNGIEQIEFSEQLSLMPMEVEHSLGFENDDVLNFIESNCSIVALKCDTEEFKGLFDLYLELNQTQKMLLEEAKNQYEVQSLMKYIVQTEKERTEIGKQLIYLIMS